jgi:hypothetical protein
VELGSCFLMDFLFPPSFLQALLSFIFFICVRLYRHALFSTPVHFPCFRNRNTF